MNYSTLLSRYYNSLFNRVLKAMVLYRNYNANRQTKKHLEDFLALIYINQSNIDIFAKNCLVDIPLLVFQKQILKKENFQIVNVNFRCLLV